jgi:type VI secretion system protein ImpG
MRDELLGYYERELSFVRQMGAEFALKYPKIAARLSLEADKCEDPHVERMIEAFAFLAGRLRLKVDDEFPEVTESLLNILYPHYLAPIPSMSIVQFSLDPERGKLSTGYHLEKGTQLYSRPVQGTSCRFRTCYPTVLWPLEVASASLESRMPPDSGGRWPQAVIKIGLRSLNETPFSELTVAGEKGPRPIDSLRLFVDGEPQLVYPLYEAILSKAVRVELRPGSEEGQSADTQTKVSPIVLQPSCLKPVGFGVDEGMLPYSARSFMGYRLLTEYFSFPEKFLFFDVTGVDAAARAGFGQRIEILIYLKDLSPPRSTVDSGTFKLGCTPIVNLFGKIAEPILLTHQQNEYHVIPDIHRPMGTEIYSIETVTAGDLTTKQFHRFQPFYSFRHTPENVRNETFWYATRRSSNRADDPGTEAYLTLVDLGFNPNVPAGQTVIIHTTCTNRDLPGKLPFGGREGELEIEGAAPLSRVRCLKKPTDTVRPPMRRGAQWRLISHLSLNHLSLVEGDNALESLREILLLYDFSDSSATRKQIAGINKVESRRVVRHIGSRIGAGFVRGIETSIEFDEDQFVGSGVFLFASVLERFLALYASVNSFSQLVARSKQRQEHLKRWPASAGEQIVL